MASASSSTSTNNELSARDKVLSKLSAPELATKNLALINNGGKRKVRLSSNFIEMMEFDRGSRITASPNGSMNGFTVRPDPNGKHQVYSRTYSRPRSNNPLEAVIEFGGQKFIDECFPSYTQRFHVEMRNQLLVFSPMANRVHAIHTKAKRTQHRNAYVALTGGVDIHCLEALGWRASVVLEHRPREARDIAQNRDLSEVHALNTLVNGSPSILINEDIYSIEASRLERILSEAEPTLISMFSIGCDDHSPTKSPKDVEKSFEDMSTMYDMVYPVLKQIEILATPVVIVENVRGFAKSGAGRILTTTLRRLGYHVTEEVISALPEGATQGRTRYYMVASIYPGFEFTPGNNFRTETLRSMLMKHIGDCRDVTSTKSIKARSTKSRNMPSYITMDSLYCSTILKSQDRGISDAVYIEHEGRILKPSVELIQELMSIPDTFDVSWMAREQATETLGQSVDYKLHQSVMRAVSDHIEANIGKSQLVRLDRH